LPCSQPGYNSVRSKTATIRTRIEPSRKSEVEDILSQLGLTASETVQLLYRQIKLQRGLPFDVRIPNALTARTLHASQAGKNVKRFGSKKELFADLRSEINSASKAQTCTPPVLRTPSAHPTRRVVAPSQRVGRG
jgi:DNA-damage-inducible protein J